VEADPLDTLIRMAGGYCVNRSLHVVADIGVADALGDVPQTAEKLAQETGCNADALGRVLSLLASHGIFKKEGERFAHSAASKLLRSDHPQSARSLVRMLGMPLNWAAYGEMEHTVRTGRPAIEKIEPEGFWAYFSKHPKAARVFDEAMAGKAHGQVAGVLNAYSFKNFKVIADIGGGQGHLLRGVLEATPTARGILFDLPQVIQNASRPASDRLVLQAGDFFKDSLPTADAYLLMEVIHDWSDKESAAILSAVRRAAPAHAKLLAIESIVRDESRPNWPQMLDINMLTLVTGRQRTIAEYAKLLEAAGFRFLKEIPTGANVSIIEAEAA
jgi:hypothetical protein